MKYAIIITLVFAVLLLVYFTLNKDWKPSLSGYVGNPEANVNPFAGVSFNPLIGQTGHIYNELGQQIA